MNYKLHSEAIKYVGNKYENIDKDKAFIMLHKSIKKLFFETVQQITTIFNIIIIIIKSAY